MKRVCTILFVILSVLCLSWPLASMAKKRALLIGISHYPQTTKSNPCTRTNIHGSNDVRLLRGTLQKQGFRITTLTNAQATASHIRRALKRLCQQAAKGDMVVIHFSGHGQPFEYPYPFAVFLSLFSLLYQIYVFFRTRLPISSLKNMYFSEVIYQRL